MIVSVTVTAKAPVTIDLDVDMDGPMPTEPYEQALWSEVLETKVTEAVNDKAGDLEMDGYLAEWMVTEAGGWETTVRAF